jgi:hypothetical protein
MNTNAPAVFQFKKNSENGDIFLILIYLSRFVSFFDFRAE